VAAKKGTKPASPPHPNSRPHALRSGASTDGTRTLRLVVLAEFILLLLYKMVTAIAGS